MGHRAGPLGANGFFCTYLGYPLPIGPIEKKNGAKILIFYDFTIFLIFTLKWPPNGAKRPQVGANT